MGGEDDLAFGVSGFKVIGDGTGHRSLDVIPVEDVVPGRVCLGKQFVADGLLDEFLGGLENEDPFPGSD
jgi:hypothetical protein